MTALAILATALGVLLLLVGAFVLFREIVRGFDREAFLFALGVTAAAVIPLALTTWGLSYLLGA